MGRKILALIGGLGLALSFSADWGAMFETKHNLYREGDKQIPTYRYDRTDFNIFCFSCHVRATPHAGTDRFSTYAYGVAELKDKNLYPQTLVCFSCHDGFIAPNISPTKLGAHHPFFVTYREEKFVLRSPSTLLTGWVGAQRISDLVERFNGTLQCVSCHEPHVNVPSFLRRSNEGSAFCLGCHEK
ncbi:MAG TPA: hypothetical protein ENJ61_06950 [Aquifex aeolicus]|uniref:Doubled CXXCH motif domain-containing protein n=1 Tax=Aquifex aeolicus TaxID=63363 RepID=A0A7C5L6E5_AQUAO|nr:hypothetical protein [Aquifex aeolicus]